MFKGNSNGKIALGIVIGFSITIFTIVWIFGLNFCPNQPCNYGQAAYHPNETSADRIWQVPDPTRGTFSYEAEPEYREGDPTRYEYYDLRAQERMAHATDWIAWLTFVTGFVGTAGLCAIIDTLNLQREANRIQRDQQRPWLTFDCDECWFPELGEKNTDF